MAFLPDGKSFVTANGKTLQRWNAATGEPIGDPMEHPHPVLHLRVSRDGQRLLSLTTGRHLSVWVSKTGKLVAATPGVGGIWDVAINPTGDLVALAGHDGQVRYWNPVSNAFESDAAACEPLPRRPPIPCASGPFATRVPVPSVE